MSKDYTPIPYEQRESQKLTFGDYFRKRISIVLIAPALSGLGYLLGRQVKQGARMTPEERKNAPAWRWALEMMDRNPHAKTKGPSYSHIGLGIGGTIASYLLWRRDEKKHVQISDMIEELKEVAPLHKGNEDFQKDNALLVKQILHEREKQQSLAYPYNELGHEQRLLQESAVGSPGAQRH
jgi:hypothetical protein